MNNRKMQGEYKSLLILPPGMYGVWTGPVHNYDRFPLASPLTHCSMFILYPSPPPPPKSTHVHTSHPFYTHIPHISPVPISLAHTFHFILSAPLHPFHSLSAPFLAFHNTSSSSSSSLAVCSDLNSFYTNPDPAKN